MSSYHDDDTLPLQPPIRLPAKATLAAAVRAAPLAEELKPEGDDTEVLAFWAARCRERLAEDEGLLLELVRLFLSREPLRGEASETLTGLGLVRQAEPYTLSWLGLWVARQIIAETTGQDIPVMGTLADADAATLLHGLRSYPESERGEELAGWLKGRDERQAVDEIASVLGTVSPLSRAVGVELLWTAFGEDGRQALTRLLEEPKLGAVIAARIGKEERQPSPEEIAWVLVDMAAALLEFGGETGEVIESIAMGMQAEEQAGTIAILAFGDHPWTGQVLRVLIEHHPDERVAAAARKALRRLRGLADLRG
ncbi:unnamed protein product [[Actinomadura] parvosata subsp. kistnae]|uniref:Uncharacterized protein n=1 Tax=[Actinomadura] parvosata subsp. kistnae TaxID=1909395 RepID=A0A1V0A1V3_9ACTN|nr:hypothetical protein [Nonomuraea sp. ATCC 55076]AQZ64167.1 hypothetical protein BKM31_24275 [Nonomuraea sp. ATCC 55076]SPL87347.1 unnamed protein product [Actinomadura parvosata subsp. kistnae]